MNDDAIQRAILERLYRVRCEKPKDTYDFDELVEDIGVERDIVLWNWEHLRQKGLVTAWSTRHYRITDSGFWKAEECGIAPKELAQENRRIREEIILMLSKLPEFISGRTDLSWPCILEAFGITQRQYDTNIGMLKEHGYVDQADYNLTANGWDEARRIQDHRNITNDFEAIEAMQPRQRGRELEKILERLLILQGWSVRRDGRPETEQLDLVADKAREYYMLECKWEKEPIEARVVRELSSRLRKRVGVHGVLLSMSGFTSGAIDETKTFLMERLILLFDRSDVEAVIYGHRSFDELLTEKFDAAMVRREIRVGTKITEQSRE